jgi:hypothetical protein
VGRGGSVRLASPTLGRIGQTWRLSKQGEVSAPSCQSLLEDMGPWSRHTPCRRDSKAWPEVWKVQSQEEKGGQAREEGPVGWPGLGWGQGLVPRAQKTLA